MTEGRLNATFRILPIVLDRPKRHSFGGRFKSASHSTTRIEPDERMIGTYTYSPCYERQITNLCCRNCFARSWVLVAALR